MSSADPKNQIRCPHCGNKFVPEQPFEHEIRERLEKEFEEKLAMNKRNLSEGIRKQEEERFRIKMQALEQDRTRSQQRMKDLETQVLSMSQKEMELKMKQDQMEIEMRKRLLEREQVLRDQLEKTAKEKAEVLLREKESLFQREKEMMAVAIQKKVSEEVELAREQERFRQAELQKKLDDQHKLINEMKRKSEQGSMQTQGEVQELAIEEYLMNSFPRDTVEEISKGKRGGDCLHIVKDQFERVCGKILYESKRTKHFSHEWISKLKDDMRLNVADVGVIVTEALPDGMQRFGEIEGIWVCTFSEFKALSYLFRFNMVRMGELLASQENRGDKMNMIYSYVTSNEFKQKLEAAFESYNDLQDDLQKEKTLFMSQWAKREKRLYKAMENIVSLYGDVRGIAGGAVQEIKALEVPALELTYNQ